MARKKPKLASKKSEKSKHNKGPTTNLDFEVGELEGNVDVGLGSVGAEVELETGGLAEGTSMDIIIELDVSPIEFDLDYDPTSSELSGSIEIGLPGDLIGVTGGLTVNTETGEVTAITGGVALAGLELEITTGVGKYACRTVSTVTFFGIGYSVTQDNCRDDGDGTDNNDDDGGDVSDGMSTGEMEGQIDSLAGVVGCHNFISIGPTPGLFFDCNANVTNTSDYGNPTQYMIGPGNVLGDNGSLADKVAAGWALLSGGAKNLAKFYINGNLIYDAINPWSVTNHEWDNYPTRPVSYQAIGKIYTYAHSLTGGGYTRSVVIRFDGAKVEDIKEAFRRAISTVLFTTGLKNYYSFDNPKKLGEYFSSPWVEEPNRIVGFDNSINSLGAACGCNFYSPLEEKPPPAPPSARPRPHRRRRENPMNEDCCKAILEMLTGVANVTGVSETYSYPLPVKVKNEVVESYNLIHYHALKPGVDDVLKVIGSVPEDAGVFPIEIYVQQNPTDRRPTKIEVNNISQLLFLVGNSTGYNDVNKPVELRLNKDNRVFTYRSLGDAIRELMPVLAPHKMVYANKDNGYVIPFEQLTPQGEGYDTTKDYLGIYTRLFSSVQRYGFDSPVYIKLKDKDPNIEGDEEAGYTVLNLAGAIEKLLYYQKEIGEDIDTQTNLLIRLSFLLTRTYSMVIKSWYRITAILDGLNISVKQIAVNAVVEFNLLAGKIFKPGQGFENKDNNDNSEPPELELDLTDEDTTNNLLDKLLDNSELDLSVDKLKKKNGKQK